jgi:hypothetical protein
LRTPSRKERSSASCSRAVFLSLMSVAGLAMTIGTPSRSIVSYSARQMRTTSPGSGALASGDHHPGHPRVGLTERGESKDSPGNERAVAPEEADRPRQAALVRPGVTAIRAASDVPHAPSSPIGDLARLGPRAFPEPPAGRELPVDEARVMFGPASSPRAVSQVTRPRRERQRVDSAEVLHQHQLGSLRRPSGVENRLLIRGHRKARVEELIVRA